MFVNLLQGAGTMGQNVGAQEQEQQQQQQQQHQQQGWPVPAARTAYRYPSAQSAGPSAHQFQQGSSTGGHHHVPHGGGLGAHPMNPASYYQPQ
ncbi:hypothetical protein CC2G_002690 [Coprinopsis cinerea AmutBmut pab1-1]|nr:hypothetical protein CC2G_002690 [Coprinopsis cinerea AmutBmut pab1-1]